MDRRSFLRMSLGIGGLSFTSMGLTACQGVAADVPRVLGLKNSVPPQLIKQFRRQMAASAPASPTAQLVYNQSSQLAEIFQQLQLWQQVKLNPQSTTRPAVPLPTQPAPKSNDVVPDLVTLGDYWLGMAIKQGLIEPLDRQAWSHWSAVDSKWRQLVQRDATSQMRDQGLVWAAPYRWGATVIAYRTDLFAQHHIAPPQDWQDLFNPQLKRRFSLLDSPREVIGLALKHLGVDYVDRTTGQPTDLSQVADLEVTLQQLQQQTKLYSSDAYLQPLILGHTWLAVGWSSDLLPQLRTRSNIKVVIPRSGTTVWADMWVRPKRQESGNQRDYNPWIDAFWQAAFADKLALLSYGGSPLTARAPVASAAEQRQNPLLNITDALWQKCEPLPPLSPAKIRQYDNLWEKIRQSSAL